MDKRRAMGRQTEAMEQSAADIAELKKEVKAVKTLLNKVLKKLDEKEKS